MRAVIGIGSVAFGHLAGSAAHAAAEMPRIVGKNAMPRCSPPFAFTPQAGSLVTAGDQFVLSHIPAPFVRYVAKQASSNGSFVSTEATWVSLRRAIGTLDLLHGKGRRTLASFELAQTSVLQRPRIRRANGSEPQVNAECSLCQRLYGCHIRNL